MPISDLLPSFSAFFNVFKFFMIVLNPFDPFIAVLPSSYSYSL